MNRQTGVTIIELMVSVGVLAILAAVAVPSYQFLIANNQVSTQSNRLLGSLLYARSESVKRGQNVTVCWSASGTACGGVSGQGWSDGWMAFVDVGADGIYHSGTDTLIKVEAEMPGGHTIKSSYASSVSFEPDGSADAFGNFTLCSADNAAQNTRQVDVSRSGRPRVTSQGVCP